MIFCPLAIPLIPNKRQILDTFSGDESFAWWREETLLGEKDLAKPFGPAGKWTAKAKKYPQLIEWIQQNLPFEYFTYIRIARSRGDVWPHVDANYATAPLPHHMTMEQWMIDHIRSNEPAGYRFIVGGSRTNLYMCKRYDPNYKDVSILDQSKHYCTIPESTDAFVINHQDQPHGVDVDESDRERLVGFVIGKLNVDRHKQLLKISSSKYSQHTVESINE